MSIEERKQQHVDLILKPESQTNLDLFAGYHLPYKALPELNLEAIDTSAQLLTKQLRQPLIIASMTGGSQHGMVINKNLAIAAEETGVAMGVGSQRIALELDSAKESFKL